MAISHSVNPFLYCFIHKILLEEWVSLFNGMAKDSSPRRFGFLSAYIFAVGAFIFVGTARTLSASC